jgi:hypothetical protein
LSKQPSTAKSREWKQTTDHWIIASADLACIAWRQNAAYFEYSDPHRTCGFPSTLRALSTHFTAPAPVASAAVAAPATSSARSAQRERKIFDRFKQIATTIIQQTESHQYLQINNPPVLPELDTLLVKDISQELLQRGVPPDSVCFYNLPLSVTSCRDGSNKSREWKQATDHWIVASADLACIAWRQDAAVIT